jgi:hypothetical protein
VSACPLEERTVPIFVQAFIEDFAGGTRNLCSRREE